MLLRDHGSCNSNDQLHLVVALNRRKFDFRHFRAPKPLTWFCRKKRNRGTTFAVVLRVPNSVSIQQRGWSGQTSNMTQFGCLFFFFVYFATRTGRTVRPISMRHFGQGCVFRGTDDSPENFGVKPPKLKFWGMNNTFKLGEQKIKSYNLKTIKLVVTRFSRGWSHDCPK